MDGYYLLDICIQSLDNFWQSIIKFVYTVFMLNMAYIYTLCV